LKRGPVRHGDGVHLYYLRSQRLIEEGGETRGRERKLLGGTKRAEELSSYSETNFSSLNSCQQEKRLRRISVRGKDLHQAKSRSNKKEVGIARPKNFGKEKRSAPSLSPSETGVSEKNRRQGKVNGGGGLWGRDRRVGYGPKKKAYTLAFPTENYNE